MPEAQRSQFVTVVAWIFIVLGGFTTLISLLQNVMLNTVFPIDQMQEQMASNPTPMPAMFQWMTSHFRLFFLAFFLVALTTLVSAIGLLRRRNWGRLAFIGILALGILWNLGGFVLQQMMMSEMLSLQPTGAQADFENQMQGFMVGMRIFSAIFAIGFSALFAWIAWRLMSPRIVAEFE